MMNRFGKMVELLKNNKSIVLIATLVVVGAFYFGFRNQNSSSSTDNTIETDFVERGDLKVSVTASGQVFARNQVDIRPQVAGDGLDVISVNVRNDQEVKKGDLIAVLDSKDAQKSIRDAKNNLRSSEIKLKQTKKQYPSKTEDDKWARQLQEMSVSENRDKLTDAQEKIQDYYIRAPFDGIVTGLSVEAGGSISRDEILASVITQKMYAKVSLNEIDALKVKTGDKAVLTFNALDSVSIDGIVQKINTIGTVEQGVVYYDAEVSFDDQDNILKPGMNVSAEITIESKENVLTVPLSSIQNRGGNDYVQLVPEDGGDPVSKTVEVGITDGVVTEVVSGVSDGDQIVIRSASPTTTSSNNNSNSASRGLLDFSGSRGRNR